MLYGYSAQAITNDANWLHHRIVAAVESVHALVDKQQKLPEWPQIFSQISDAQRKKLASRDRTLGIYFQSYYEALDRLTETERKSVLDTLHAQNKIPDIFQDTGIDCLALQGLPGPVHVPIKQIFEYAFDDLLDTFDIRDKHYELVFKHAPAKMCPFCGLVLFKAPGKKREAYDHYLTECRYPFAGANLRNLVPMCHDCNSGEKLQKDVLRDAFGARRRVFDPYNIVTPPSISLDRSRPFEGKDDQPQWIIDFISSAAAEVETWKDVFQIERRYACNVLEVRYNEWLGAWKKDVRSRGFSVKTPADLINELMRYEAYWDEPRLQDQNFLKRPVFSMLRVHCQQGHSRLIDFLRDHLNK